MGDQPAGSWLRNSSTALTPRHPRPAGTSTGGCALIPFSLGWRHRPQALRAAAKPASYGKPLPQQILDATIDRPLRGSDPAGIPLKGPQAQDLGDLLAALEKVESAFGQATMPQPYKPEPPPSL